MNPERILVTRRPPGKSIDRLRDHGDVWMWEENLPLPREVLLKQIGATTALYSMLTDTIDVVLLEAAPALRIISQMAVGVDNVDVPACTARGIPVGHTPDVLTETTADTAFALLLAAARRIVEGSDYVRAGKWQRWEPDLLLGRDVWGSVLGIIGLGRIGSAVARRADGFGMRVLYTGRRPGSTEAEFRTLPELLSESDHVVVATPLTAETLHLIDARALRMMKPTATLVNISRGGTVDPDALTQALDEGWIAAAALDVTEPEPIPPDHPLVMHPRCVIVPHLGSSSRETREAMAELAVENLVRGLDGTPMRACVNPAVYLS
jgi:lactate dehydrogenase-like 2-hydroxyacid dehydrogenase